MRDHASCSVIITIMNFKIDHRELDWLKRPPALHLPSQVRPTSCMWPFRKSKTPRNNMTTPVEDVTGVYVVVVFGRTGVGVSSLVNLIIGREVAKYHNDGTACTKQKASYRVAIDGRNVDVFDIPGFEGSVPEDQIVRTIVQIHQERGIDLLINCLRPKDGLFASIFKAAVTAVHKCDAGVPVVAVVTFLERQKETMEDWWSGPSKNGDKLAGMTFVDHACVTTLPPDGRKWGQRRLESEKVVRDLIVRHCNGVRRATR
ncbi:hypothetical protein F5I97DRAFT_1873536 [Phlebopus sp. FC_14]|nr:hypothetical protein F5I97DRAFT_1873536 [Phlebopus sp. FC_14]